MCVCVERERDRERQTETEREREREREKESARARALSLPPGTQRFFTHPKIKKYRSARKHNELKAKHVSKLNYFANLNPNNALCLGC